MATEDNQEIYNILIVTNPPVGPEKQRMLCPHCKKTIITKVELKNSAKTHLSCIILSMIGCCIFAPCVYLRESCLAKEHTCPECKKYVGTYDG